MRFLLGTNKEQPNIDSLLFSSESAVNYHSTKLVVKEIESTAQSQVESIAHSFSSSFSESIEASSNKYGTGYKSVEVLPDLPDKSGNFEWYNYVHPNSVLTEILRLSQDKSTSQSITQSDLTNVISYCDYNGWLPHIDRKKSAQLSFKILAHLAENGWQLPNKAVKVIVSAIKTPKNSTMNYAVLALAYLINNGQFVENALELLDKGIANLKKASTQNYLETIIIALSAKTNLDAQLNSKELELLEIALTNVAIKPSAPFLYIKSAIKPNPEQSGISFRTWHTTATRVAALDLILDRAKYPHLIAKKKLNYAISRWNKTTDISVKVRVSEIMCRVISNGQRKFPKHDEAMEVLKRALSDNDIDVRQNSFVSANLLLVNNQLNSALRCDFIAALNDRQHAFAMNAFCNLLNFHGYEGFDKIEKWLVFFQRMAKNNELTLTLKENNINHKLINIAKYLSCRLEKNIDNLNNLITDLEYSIMATESILIAVEKRQIVSSDIINKLFVVIKGDFPEKAKHNALLSFRYIAENGQDISKDHLDVIVEKYIKNDNNDVKNTMLVLIGYCIRQHESFIKNKIIIKFHNLINNLCLLDNIIFVLAKIVETSNGLENWKDFDLISSDVINLLQLNKCANNQQKLIVLLLGKAAEKGVVYSNLMINKLAMTLNQFPQEKDIRLKILHIIGLNFKNCTQSKLSDESYEQLMSSCSSSEEVNDIVHILASEIHRSLVLPKKRIINNIVSLTAKYDFLLLNCELFEALVAKRYLLPDVALQFILSNFDKGSVEEKIRILAILSKASIYQAFPFVVLKDIIISQIGLTQESTQYCVAILEHMLQHPSQYYKPLINSTRCHVELLKVVKGYGYDLTVKTRSIKIINTLSAQKDARYSMHFLKELIPLLASEDRDIRCGSLEIIKHQIVNLELYIFNKNVVMTKLIEAVCDRLHDSEQQCLVLYILKAATSYGYLLSKDLLTSIARLLYTLENTVARVHICALLSNQYDAMSSEARLIYKTELLGCEINEVISSEDACQEAFRSLILDVRNGIRMTQQVFVGMRKILEDKRESLFEELINLCISIQEKGYVLPNSLLSSMSQFMSENKGHRYFEHFAQITSFAIVHHQSVDHKLYENVEYILSRKDVGEKSLLLSIEALKVAVKRKFNLKNSSIQKLFQFVIENNTTLTSLSAQLLVAVFKSGQVDLYSQTYPIKALVNQLQQCHDRTLRIELEKLILSMSFFVELDLNETSIIKNQLLLCNDYIEQSFLLNTLITQSKERKLSDEYYIVIHHKELENRFLSQDNDESKRIKLFPELIKNTSLLTTDSYLIIATLLNSLPENETLQMIENLTDVLPHNVLPDEFIFSIIELLENKTYSMAVNKLLCELTDNQQHFSIQSLDLLNSIMILDENDNTRKSAYKLLERIKSKRSQIIPDYILLQMKTEEQSLFLKENNVVDLKQQIEIIRNYVFNNCSLSKGNIKFLLLSMQENHELVALVLDILNHTKDSLVKSSCQDIVYVLINYICQSEDHALSFRAANLCGYIVGKKIISKDSSELVLKKLEDHIKINKCNKNGMGSYIVKLWQGLNHCSASTQQESIYIQFIEHFFVSDDKSYRLEVLSALSKYLLLTKSPTVGLLKASKSFKRVIFEKQWPFISFFKKILINDTTTPFSDEVKTDVTGLLAHIISHHQADELLANDFIIALSEEIKKKHQGERFLSLLASEVNMSRRVYLMLVFASLHGKCKIDTIEKISVKDYSRHLLCHDLITRCDQSGQSITEEQQQMIYSQWASSKSEKDVDDLLRLLIIKQKSEKLTADEVIELLTLYNNIDQSPLELTDFNNKELWLLWINNLLSKLPLCRLLEPDKVLSVHNYFIYLEWDIELIKNFFNKLQLDTSYEAIVSFLASIKEYKFQANYIESQINNFEKTACSLEYLEDHIFSEQLSNHIDEIINKFSHSQSSRLADEIFNIALELFYYGWSIHGFIAFFKRLAASEVGHINVKNIYDFMDIAFRYRQYFQEEDFYYLYENNGHHGFTQVLHSYVMNQCFKKELPERDLPELLRELKSDVFKASGTDIDNLIKKADIDNVFNLTELFYVKKASIFLKNEKTNDEIKEWSEENITTWVTAFREYIEINKLDYTNVINNSSILAEIFAVLKRACVIQFSYEPRVVQLLSVLLMTRGKMPQRGLFTQIGTGEGKSLIIAMMAVIKALTGKKVDIVTSSPILADRDANFFAEFYQLFSLKSASNIDKDYKKGLKDCYRKEIDIVYGDVDSFQFDILRDQYSRLETRGDRGFDSLIVDEVDNLLIDEGSKIAMLSSVIPSMNELRPILTLIWLQLKKLNQMRLNPDQDFGDYKNPFRDIMQGNLTLEEQSKQIFETLVLSLESYIDDMILKGKSKIPYPKHLREFVQCQKSRWVQSALTAFYDYKNKRNYTIKTNNRGVEVIMPVDFSNTGVVQQGTMWADGLHQFLQIKHGLKVTSENITTNYLSNVSFVKKYKGDVTAITATMGSEESQKLLDNVYKVDFLKMPTFLPKQLIELPVQIAEQTDKWMESITNSAILEANQGRVTLIICETIEDVKAIKVKLQCKFTGKYFDYSDNLKDNTQFFEQELEGNTIVIATNLAGRGTDLKVTKDVIEKGGVHVCMTFLPANLRVEQQAFGRAARRGEPGGAQLMLNKEKVIRKLYSINEEDLKKLDLDASVVKEFRDAQEKNRIDVIRDEELPINDLKDELFNNYLKLLDELDKIDEKQKNDKPLSYYFDFSPSTFVKSYYDSEMKDCKRGAVEEEWGFWLKKQDFSKDPQQIKSLFIEFKNNIITRYKNDTIIKNPVYYMRLGNKLLSYANSSIYKVYKNEFCQIAKSAYDRAIALDEKFAHNATYHKVYALILLAEDGYKHEVKLLLQELLESLYTGPMEKEQAMLHLLSQETDQDEVYKSQAGYTQAQNRLQTYQLFANSIINSIENIEKSLRLINIELQGGKGEFTQIHKLLKDQAIDIVGEHSGLVSVSFNHLRTYNDLWKNSQLINTVEKIPDVASITIAFDSRRLDAPYAIKKALKKLLPINRYKNDKDIEKNKKAQEESKNNAESEELYGIGDALSYAGSKVYNYGKTAVDEVSTYVDKSHLGKTVKAGTHIVKDIYYHSKEAEKIPVSLELTLSAPSLVSEMLSVCRDFIECRRELIIRHISINLIEFFKARCYPVSIELCQLISDNKHRQEYQKKSINEISNINDDMQFTELHILNCSDQQLTEIIADLQSPEGKQCIKTLPHNSTLNLKIENLTQKHAQNVIESSQGEIKLFYEDINKQQAKDLLEHTVGQHDHAVMIVANLKVQEAITLMHNAQREEQPLAPSHSSIQEELSKITDDQEFHNEFSHNGYFYLYDVYEKKPLPWKSMLMLATLSAIQVAGGVALTGFTMGFAANVGFSFIAEGINDVFRLATTAYTREFSLNSYLTQKSLSLAFSISMAGIASAFAAKGGASIAGRAVDLGMQYGDEAVNTTMVFSNVVKNISGVGLKEAVKRTAISFAEAATSEAIEAIINKSSVHLLAAIKPHVTDRMSTEMSIVFANARLKQILIRAFAIDKFIGDDESKYFLPDIENKAKEIVTMLKFSIPDLKLSDDIGVAKFNKEFHVHLTTKTEVEISNFGIILHHKFPNIEEEKIERICQLLKQNKILNERGIINLDTLVSKYSSMQVLPENEFKFVKAHHDINNYRLKEMDWDHELLDYREIIIKACLEYHVCLQDDYYYQYEKFTKNVSNLFTDHVMNTFTVIADMGKATLSRAASYGINRLSDKLNSGNKQKGNKGSDTNDLDSKGGTTASTSNESMQTNTNSSNMSKTNSQMNTARELQYERMLAKKRMRNLIRAVNLEGVTTGRAKGLPTDTINKLEWSGVNTRKSRIKKEAQDLFRRCPDSMSEMHDQISILKERMSKLEKHIQKKRVQDRIRHKSGTTNNSTIFDPRKQKSRKKLPIANDSILSDVKRASSQRTGASSGSNLLDRINGSKTNQSRNFSFFDNINTNMQKAQELRKCIDLTMISTGIIGDAVIVSIEQEIKTSLADSEALIRKVAAASISESRELVNKILYEKSKIILALIEIILLGLLSALNKTVEDSTIDMKELKSRAIKLFHDSLIENVLSYKKLIDFFHQENANLSASFLGFLDEEICDYNKLIKEKNNMLQIIEKVDVNGAMGNVFDMVKSQKFDQFGMLLKDGQLGQGGFIVGSLMKGVLDNAQASTAAHHRTQVLIIKLAENMVNKQAEFLMEVVKIDEGRVQLVKEIQEGYDEKLKKYFEFMEKAEKYKEEYMKGKEAISKEFADHFRKEATGFRKSLDMFMENITKVAQSNGIDPKFLSNCTTAHQVIMDSMMQTVRALGAHQTSTIEKLIDSTKELIEKRIEANSKSTDSEKEATEKSTANNPQRLMPPPASSEYKPKVLPSTSVAILVLKSIEIKGDKTQYKKQICDVLKQYGIDDEPLDKDARLSLANMIQQQIKDDLAKGNEIDDDEIGMIFDDWKEAAPTAGV